MAVKRLKIEVLTSLDEILPVLAGSDLPVDDISASSRPQFFGIRIAGSLVAVVGIEVYQSIGLLRSLAVAPGYRGRGLARKLVAFAEFFATSRGVERLFLLTTTAKAFFIKLGYIHASRKKAPQAIRATAQFSQLCPSSAAFLCKQVTVG